MPYGSRWETLIEGLRDSKPNPKNSLTKKKIANPLSFHGGVRRRKGVRTAQRFVPGFPSAGDGRCSALNALQWKNSLRAPARKSPMPLCCYSERDAKNAGTAERGVTSIRDPRKRLL